MKLIVAVVFTILCFSSVFAVKEYASANMHYTAEGNFSIQKNSVNAKLESMDFNIHLYPQNTEIISNNNFNLEKTFSGKNTVYSGEHIGDTNLILWKINLTITRQREVNMLDSAPKFPYTEEDFPDEIKEYLEFTPKVDITEEMIEKANEIVSGSSDYISAAMKLAEWVNSYITYDITFNEAVSGTLSASQVYELRRGVCDEYAVLFMSMCRAVGIASKYAYGYAYSNLLEGFGAHAWAEVYVPDYGWISFDATEGYGEYGWLDALHIKNSESRNITGLSIYSSYTGYDLNNLIISQNNPLFLTSGFSGKAEDFITVDSYENETKILTALVEFSKTDAGENDYVLMTVKVFNPTDKYIPLSYTITTTSSMEIADGPAIRGVYLKPESQTISYAILKTPTGMFGHPVRISAPLMDEAGGNINVYPRISQKTSFEELEKLIESKEDVSKDIEIKSLAIDKTVVYDENPVVTYTLRNSGNTVLRNVNIEISSEFTEKYSENISLININQEQIGTVELNLGGLTGEGNINISVSGAGETKTESIIFVSAVKPEYNLELTGKTIFETGEDIIINITAENLNQINTTFLSITISANENSRTYEYYPGRNDVVTDKGIERSFFNSGLNNITIALAYKDNYGTLFYQSKSFEITVNLSFSEVFFKAIDNFFKIIAEFFRNLFKINN
ncbi:MAG: transglutaminase-like domain-containing protein [Candidatus Nanoarchaeia archaeon]|nr:transglutaminase-like domain-containing protein [Candidatus Nanoarchaeia archaeon]